MSACVGKIRLQGLVEIADDGTWAHDPANPLYFLIRERKVALPLYPQFGTEPNGFYIPPRWVPRGYLTQMFGPGVDHAMEQYACPRPRAAGRPPALPRPAADHLPLRDRAGPEGRRDPRDPPLRARRRCRRSSTTRSSATTSSTRKSCGSRSRSRRSSDPRSTTSTPSEPAAIPIPAVCARRERCKWKRPRSRSAADLARECLYRFLAAVAGGPYSTGWGQALDAAAQDLALAAAEWLGSETAPSELRTTCG